MAADHSPDVSIILLTYNRAEFLSRTLDCILNQTYRHFELWICDDCSTDGTADICAAYAARDVRIRYVRNTRNLQMPGNLNAGIRRSNCGLVAVLHDGDIYAPTLIEKWREALLRNPTAGFAFNAYRHLEPNGTSGTVTDIYPQFMTGRYFLEKLCFGDREMECPVWGTVMGRRQRFEEMELFNPRFGFWSDMDMYFRLAEKHDVTFVPEALIDLPSRQVMPHLFSSGAWTAHSTIFRMYWEARCRHYRDRPVVMLTALSGQVRDFVATKTRRAVGRAVRRTIERLKGTGWAEERVQEWRRSENRFVHWIARIRAPWLSPSAKTAGR